MLILTPVFFSYLSFWLFDSMITHLDNNTQVKITQVSHSSYLWLRNTKQIWLPLSYFTWGTPEWLESAFCDLWPVFRQLLNCTYRPINKTSEIIYYCCNLMGMDWSDFYLCMEIISSSGRQICNKPNLNRLTPCNISLSMKLIWAWGHWPNLQLYFPDDLIGQLCKEKMIDKRYVIFRKSWLIQFSWKFEILYLIMSSFSYHFLFNLNACLY